MEDRVKLQTFKVKLTTAEFQEEKGSFKGRDPRAMSNIENRKILEDASEYWDYLNSGKSWDLRRDGLLYFVLDCFYEITTRNWLIDETLSEALTSVRIVLQQMEKVIHRIEETYAMDFPKYTVLIRECIESFPNKKIIRIGKQFHVQSDGVNVRMLTDENDKDDDFWRDDSIEQEAGGKISANDIFSLMMHKIKTYIMHKKISINDFYHFFVNHDDKISVLDFRARFLELLKTSVTPQEVDGFLSVIRRRGGSPDPNFIFLNRQLIRRLRKEFERQNPANYKTIVKEDLDAKFEDTEKVTSTAISKEFEQYLKDYKKHCLQEDKNADMEDFVQKLNQKLAPLFEKDQDDQLIDFIVQMKKTFRRPTYKILFLRILKGLISKYNYELSADAEEEEVREREVSLKKIQRMMDRAHISNFCLEFFMENSSLDLISTATDVLILLLLEGNRDVQVSVLDQLKEGNMGFTFFNFIKNQLWLYITNYNEVADYRKRHQSGLTIDAKRYGENHMELQLKQQDVTRKLLQLLQLFCENVFSDFQVRTRVLSSLSKFNSLELPSCADLQGG